MGIQVVGHTSYLGHTGYANHSRNFFTHLSRLIPVHIRNYSYVKDLSYLTEEERNIIIEQEWKDEPYKVGNPFIRNPNDKIINIVLNESNHYYFYDKYPNPKIAYNVWESTRQVNQFFAKALEYDQFWCPTEWQRQCTIEQGYPEDRVRVVPEAVEGNLFFPNSDKMILKNLYKKYKIPEDKFCFMIFGRWDYRKSITETIQAFLEEFKNDDNIILILSSDNPFPVDKLSSTEQRLKHYKLESEKVKILHFPDRNEYIQWMRSGHVFLSCSRAEGWNLPLIEAIASGTPSICSDWGAQLEFSNGIAHTVNIEKMQPPKNVFQMNNDVPGEWAEPDFNHLKTVMRNVYNDYSKNKDKAVKLSSLVRKIYTWENAARIGYKHITELSKTYFPIEKSTPEEEKIKINLGCGNDIKPGYINIDRFNNLNNIDIVADISNLPFQDNTVDEVYVSHVLEHVSLHSIYEVVDEWRRVLKPTGELIVRVPNLEKEVRGWLDTPDKDKWLAVSKIYGEQSHKGNAHMCGFNIESLKLFLESCSFNVLNITDVSLDTGSEIRATCVKDPNYIAANENFICSFIDGARLEIVGEDSPSYYVVEFLDPDNKSSVHHHTMKINHWTSPHRKYFTNWLIRVKKDGKVVYEHKLDLTGKDVLISLDSKSLGDTLSWLPFVEEFRKKHKCEVYVTTFWNKLFKDAKEYKHLHFVEPGVVIPSIHASYIVGCFDDDINKQKNKIPWKMVPLQKIAADILGLFYREIRTEIGLPDKGRKIKEKYVCISEHSTFQCKYWNYENGWQEIVDYLNEIGYKVVVTSKEQTKLKNIINRTNRPIEDTVNTIRHADMFLGVSAGPSWLAWALKVPVILISGYSLAEAEFHSGVIRIINENVCHGCFNSNDFILDRGNWNWCPKHESTERQFECTKTISPSAVKKAIDIISGRIKIEPKETM